MVALASLYWKPIFIAFMNWNWFDLMWLEIRVDWSRFDWCFWLLWSAWNLKSWEKTTQHHLAFFGCAKPWNRATSACKIKIQGFAPGQSECRRVVIAICNVLLQCVCLTCTVGLLSCNLKDEDCYVSFFFYLLSLPVQLLPCIVLRCLSSHRYFLLCMSPHANKSFSWFLIMVSIRNLCAIGSFWLKPGFHNKMQAVAVLCGLLRKRLFDLIMKVGHQYSLNFIDTLLPRSTARKKTSIMDVFWLSKQHFSLNRRAVGARPLNQDMIYQWSWWNCRRAMQVLFCSLELATCASALAEDNNQLVSKTCSQVANNY